MDQEIKDEETRNWVKMCLALRCLTNCFVNYLKTKSEERHNDSITFLTTFLGVPEYKCTKCNLKTLRPYHSQKKPCKYGHDKYKCACNANGNIQCPEKTCGKLYDLIKDEHVKNNPNWSNSKSELWSDKQFGPWEMMKCFIETHGYAEKTDISEADITAIVSICSNNDHLQREFGANMTYLHKIRSIRNEVSHSNMKIKTVSFMEYIRDVKDALLLQPFDLYRLTDQLQYLDNLENDNQRITVEDEIVAKLETLGVVKELIVSLKEQLQQTQSLNDANSEGITENIKQEIAQLTVNQTKLFQQVHERHDQIRKSQEKLQNEYIHTQEWLSKIKAQLDGMEGIEGILKWQTTELCTISKGVKKMVPILEKNAGNNEVLIRLAQKIDDVEQKIDDVLKKQIDVKDMKFIVEIKTPTGEEKVAELLVESTNRIGRDGVLSKLQERIQSALNDVCKDGVQIKNVKNECMAIYCGYPNMKCWLAFLRRYLNRELDQVFLPVQTHLRTYIGYEDLELNVVIYEEDFKISVQSIFYQLDALLTDAMMITEQHQLEETPLKNKPSAPEHLSVSDITSVSCVFHWEAPTDDSGCEIQQYVVEKREANQRSWNKVDTSKTLELTVTKLVKNTQYVLRVAAQSEVGIGEFAELPQPVTANENFVVPDAPEAPKVTEISKSMATVAWQPPSKDGGSPLTGYLVGRCSDVANCWISVTKKPVNETTLFDKELAEGTTYQYRVIAQNKAGNSKPSEPSEPVKAKDLYDKPSQPGKPQVIGKDKSSVVLKWSPPTKDGGAPVRYVIEYRKPGMLTWHRANSAPVEELTYSVTGLPEGEEYEFKLTAENQAGSGPASDVSQSVKLEVPLDGFPPMILQPLSDVTVVLLKDAILECDIDLGEPEAEIKWFNGTKEVKKSSKYEISYEDAVASLVIHKTEPDDAGMYAVQAANPMGQVKCEGNLAIHTVPHLDVYERFAKNLSRSVLAQGLAGASRHVHDRESSTATEFQDDYDNAVINQTGSDMWNMEWNREDEPGMVAFIEKIHQVDSSEKVAVLYSKWTAMLAVRQIDKDIRVKLNDWYQGCYKARFQALTQQDKINMCGTFCEQLHTFICNQQEVFKKYTLQEEAKNVQKQVLDGSYVDISIACIENEHELIESIYPMETTSLCEIQEQVPPQCDNLETDFNSLEDLKASLDGALGRLQENIDAYRVLQERKEDLETRLCGIEKVLKGGKQTQKVNSQTQEMVNTQIQNTHQELLHKGTEIASLRKDCLTGVCGLYEQLGKFKQELLVRVDNWKEQMKLQYAELYAKPDLESVSKWCALLGQFVHQILIYTWPKLENTLDETNVTPQLKQLKARLTNDLKDLLCRTFVVSEQKHYILKCDKKNLPAVSVRILAADNRDLHNYFQANVTAYLVYDGDLNACWNVASNALDIKAMVKQAKTFDKDQQAFAMSKDSAYREASFKMLSLKTATRLKQFERASGKHVHEEKYRIIFVTDMNLQGICHKIWTLSLPVVVTTGANQGLQSQASVMWECFGTDVYKLPTGDCSALPWHLVAQMLRSKMRTLCDRRDLTDENMRHLKSRLLGDALRADDTEVTLKQFCFDKMEKSDSEVDNPSFLQFSFWKWFMGCYNLIDRYLRPYWSDGLIEGFLSKTDASKKLEHQRPLQDGLFILRFSDTNIVDSQGLNSIFGHLTACVMILRQDATSNRTMKKILDSLDVASSKSLEKKQLANILKDTMDKHLKGNMYKVLFPNRKWEDTFQKYLQEEESQDGKQISGNIYYKPEQSWIVDLDQKLCEIEKSVTKSDRRNTTDSDMDTHCGKRRRKRTVSDDQLSCQSSQSSPWQLPQSPSQWSMCSDASRMSDHSRMSSQSPILSDISDMGSQRPMGVHNGKTVVESVIPNMEEFSSTMIPSVVSSITGDNLMGGIIQKTLESFMGPVSSTADSFQSSQRSMFLIEGTGNAAQIAGNQALMQQFQGGLGSQFTTEVQGQHNFGFTEMLQSEYPADGNNITVYIEDQPADQATSHGIQAQPNADLILDLIGKMSLEERHKFMTLFSSAQTQTKSRPSTSTTRQTDSGGSYTLSSGEIQEGMNSGSIDPLFTDIIAGSSSSTSN